MSEMIEPVARAILAALGAGEGESYIEDADDGMVFIIEGEFDLNRVARAAIAAMREPTEDMLAAGDSMMPQIAQGEDITTGRDALAKAWSAMIDAALVSERVAGE